MTNFFFKRVAACYLASVSATATAAAAAGATPAAAAGGSDSNGGTEGIATVNPHVLMRLAGVRARTRVQRYAGAKVKISVSTDVL